MKHDKKAIKSAVALLKAGNSLVVVSESSGIPYGTLRYQMRKEFSIMPGRVAIHISLPSEFVAKLSKLYPKIMPNRALEAFLESEHSGLWNDK